MKPTPTRRSAAGGGAGAPRKRSPRATIALAPELRAHFEARGARSDKSHGPFNFTRLLTRTVELFDSLLSKSDPRQTRDMPQDDYNLVVEVLTDPLALESFPIAHLGDYLCDLQTFRARAGELAIGVQEFRDRINAYPYAEKLHLVQAAQARHAPHRRR